MKYITILSISIILVNCSTTKHYKTEKKASKSIPIEYKFDLSLQTILFLQELETERESKANSNFIPSNKLIDKYNIKKLNDIYTISGFIKTKDGYNENNLTQLNIKTNSKVGNIITIIIPISSIDTFLTLDGISYFEINKRVDLKNR